MASLGSLVVSLAADTARFQGDLGRAAQIAERRMKNIKDTAQRALGAVSILATAAGAALTRAFLSSAQSSDQLLKLSQSTGTTVESLSKLQYAAKLSGVETTQLGRALGKLASSGVKDTNKALLEIADQFAGTEDGAAKTAKAIEIFGERIGPQLIPLLNQGSAGIRAMGEEAEKLGLVVDTKTAQAAERFNDNLTRLKSAGTGFANVLAQALLPTMESLTSELVATVKNTDAMDKAARTAATGLRILLTGAELVRVVFSQVGQTFGALAASLVALFSGRFSEAFNILKDRAADAMDDVKSSADRIGRIWDEAASTAAASAPRVGSQLALPATEAAALVAAEADKIRRQADAYKDILQTGFAAVRGQESPGEAILRNFEEQKFALEELARVYPAFAETANEALTRLAVTTQDQLDAIGRVPIVMKEAEESVTQWSAFAEQGARNLQDAFAQFLFDPFSQGLKGMLSGFIDVMRRMVAEAAAAQILKGIGGLFPTGSFLGTLFSGARALGGPVTGGRSYLVGERGPEMFVPSSSGSIVPNGAGGSVTVSPTYNIDARGATTDLVKALPGILAENNRRIAETISQAMSRSGMRAPVF